VCITQLYAHFTLTLCNWQWSMAVSTIGVWGSRICAHKSLCTATVNRVNRECGVKPPSSCLRNFKDCRLSGVYLVSIVNDLSRWRSHKISSHLDSALRSFILYLPGMVGTSTVGYQLARRCWRGQPQYIPRVALAICNGLCQHTSEPEKKITARSILSLYRIQALSVSVSHGAVAVKPAVFSCV